ncbi:MAG TPA: hypothetical protein VE688_06885 [Gaiellaceae bacterium]|jgi:hypothetical protein|nr:hypothetical protein [Gaiellaceae bacterium]
MDAEARFNEIADDLAAQNADVELGKMFGMPTIKRGGKATSGFWQNSMVFKLTDEAKREQALALDGTERFDPMGGRPMREWVVVPASHSDEWPGLAREALSA